MQTRLKELVSDLKGKFSGLDLEAWVTRSGYIELAAIKVPKEQQGQGIGHAVVQSIKDFAQSVELPVVLRPEAEPRKKKKLMDFYSDLGFVKNKGRGYDPRLSSPFSATMYWKPNIQQT